VPSAAAPTTTTPDAAIRALTPMIERDLDGGDQGGQGGAGGVLLGALGGVVGDAVQEGFGQGGLAGQAFGAFAGAFGLGLGEFELDEGAVGDALEGAVLLQPVAQACGGVAVVAVVVGDVGQYLGGGADVFGLAGGQVGGVGVDAGGGGGHISLA
jgi:hypothetical protein